MYKPWTCRKCGAQMSGPNDHDTTAGCAVSWPPTITTGDTSGFVTTGPTIWYSEDARRLARYDEAVQLIEEFLRDGLEPQLARRAEAFLAAEGKVAG